MRNRLCAGIIIENKKVLLVHNAKHAPARLEPPGGKIKKGESAEVGLERELMEELGVVIRVLKFLGVFKTTSPEGAFDVETYLCEIISGRPTIVEPHIIPDFTWLKFDELVEMNNAGRLAPNVIAGLEFLKELL